MLLSAWVKASKMRLCFSRAIPIPVSEIVNFNCRPLPSLATRSTLTSTSPCCVNLMALPTRLTSTWRRRPGSPKTCWGTSERISVTSSKPFWWARTAIALVVSITLSWRLKSMGSRSSLPASILEKSRMSLMTRSRESPEDLIISRYSRCSEVSSVSSVNSAIPRIPLIGVRISWLMLARNWPLE